MSILTTYETGQFTSYLAKKAKKAHSIRWRLGCAALTHRTLWALSRAVLTGEEQKGLCHKSRPLEQGRAPGPEPPQHRGGSRRLGQTEGPCGISKNARRRKNGQTERFRSRGLAVCADRRRVMKKQLLLQRPSLPAFLKRPPELRLVFCGPKLTISVLWMDHRIRSWGTKE